MMRFRLLPGITLVAAACLWTGGSAPAATTPCPSATPSGVACATVSVPLDRSGTVAGTVDLHVERLAGAPSPAAGALVVLAGGPGQAATPFLGAFRHALAPALIGRSLVVFDQRGTGRSGRLSCPALGRARSLPLHDNATEDCARSLGPARGFYTSRDNADDIEAVRRSLGVDRISLYGVSYGTYTAMTYARRYPNHVELLVLDSVIDPGGRDPFDRSTYAAIPRVLRAVCALRCRAITRDPAADLSKLVRRLLSKPLRARAFLATGRRVNGTISAGDLLNLVEGADLDPVLRAQIPAALHSALAGDAAPLGRLLVRGRGAHGAPPGAAADSDALFLATACEEEPLPWSRTVALSERPQQAVAAIGSVPATAFLPWDRLTELVSGSARPCLRWPDASAVSPVPSGPLPDVPALILAGEQDTRTPLADAGKAAQLLPRAQLINVPGTGHSVLGTDLGPCSQTALRRFFGGQRPEACSSRSGGVAPSPLAPVRLAGLRAQRGLGGRPGRTLTAVRATLSDSLSQALGYALLGQPVAAGGLRGGRLRGTLRGSLLTVALRGIVYIPGVAVSGTLRFDLTGRARPSARVTISGPLSAHGSLTFAGGTISGRLGRRRLRVSTRAAAASEPRGDLLRLLALAPLRDLGALALPPPDSTLARGTLSSGR